MSGDGQEPTARPPLRVVSGDATAEEIAAIVAVLASTGSTDPAPASDTGRSRWAAPAARLRSPVPHGPGAWRTSARS